ncbi:MAG: CoA transferase [Actinomycetia bacterium]|nr:CoA transferase [Actinomycetes bacterium]
MSSPLDGVRIVEFANFAAAPTAAAIMADLGGEVIKVEAIGGDPVRGLMKQAKVPEGEANPDHPFQFINRGKQSIELNLDDPAGIDVAHRLVATADIVITNLLPERRQRFRLDVETLHGIKPDLVIGLLSGYGEQGDEINRPGYDVTAFFSRSGLHGGMTPPGGVPPHARPGQGDHTTAIALFGGLMAALRSRDQTGEGQIIETSLLRTATFTIALDLCTALVDGEPHIDRLREGSVSAMFEAFQCSDGHWIQFMMPDIGDAWQRFCVALERHDLMADEDLATGRGRYRNIGRLMATLDESIGSMPYDHWTPRLDQQRCIWAPINDAASAVAAPQVRATGACEAIDQPPAGMFETVAAPFRMPLNDEVGVRGPAPEAGQHTAEVLTRLLGLSTAEVAELIEGGIVNGDTTTSGAD